MDIWTFINLLRSKAISEVVFTEHCRWRLNQRGFSEEDIRKLLYDRRHLRGIIQQKKDRFKLCYEHLTNRDLDVVVIIDAKHIKSKLKIAVVTAFLQHSKRRTEVKGDENG